MDVLAQLDRLQAQAGRFRAARENADRDREPVEMRLLELESNATPAQERELRRICKLPVVAPLQLGERDFEQFCFDRIEATFFERGFRFYEPQANAIRAYEEHGGLFGAIGVGWGKTLITLAIADFAYREKGIKRSMLCVPAPVYDQLVDHDLAWCRQRIGLAVPFHKVGRAVASKRKRTVAARYEGCYIVPYSIISAPSEADIVRRIEPQLVILDEAHSVKNRRAARTRRIFSYLEEKGNEDIELCALSGTITSKGIEDYHHLIRRALGRLSPLPDQYNLAAEWGLILNSGAVPTESQAGELMPLIRWARNHWPREDFSPDVPGFRKAYRHRFTSAPGVVATSDTEIGTSLLIANVPVEGYQDAEGWEELDILMTRVEEGITPIGDVIEHAIHAYKWLYELSAGFYNELFWPSAAQLAKSKSISEDYAEELLEAAKEHHLAQQEYHRALRSWLRTRGREGLDTPLLVGNEMAQHGHRRVGRPLYELWTEMRALEVDGMPERWSRAIRICPYKVDAAVAWARELPKGKGGIVWVHHEEMGLWITEALLEAGLDALHCPAGPQANRAIVDPVNADRVAVASLEAHGEGKNLQHFEHMFYVQWPRRAVRAEQSLGRVHRNGQQADEVEARLCNTLLFDSIVFAACLQDALYIHQTTGTRQKLIYGTHNPMPAIFSPEFLREHGMENRMLNAEQRVALQDRFGIYHDNDND